MIQPPIRLYRKGVTFVGRATQGLFEQAGLNLWCIVMRPEGQERRRGEEEKMRRNGYRVVSRSLVAW